MGKVISAIRKIIFIVTMCLCLFYTYNNVFISNISFSSNLRLLNDYSTPYYSYISSNSGYTNINGISNVYINMVAEGYKIYKEDITQSYIDVSFIKEGCDSYRLYFKYPECYVTFFSSNYENSFSVLSYIIDKR